SLAWLDAIESADNLAQPVRAQLASWRIVVLGRAGAFDDLRTELERLRWDARAQLVRPLTTGQALLLIASLETDNALSRVRDELRATALSDLLLRGSLRDFSESVDRFGQAGLEPGGFASRCAQGLGMYFRAQEHEPDARAFDMRVRCARSLLEATESRDASSYEPAIGPVLLAAGVSLREASLWQMENRPGARREAALRLIEASDVLARGASRVGDSRVGGDALWLAIRCLDDARQGGQDVEPTRRGELTQRFLTLHPNHPHVATVVASQQEESREDTDEMIMRLGAVTPDSPSYDTSRRRLAQLLFAQHQQADEIDAPWAAQRYTDVAEPIVFDDAKRALAGDADAASRALIRGQRVMALLLGDVRVDVARARRVMGVLTEVHELRLTAEDYTSTLIYRHGQIALAEDDVVRVEEIRSRLAVLDDGGALLRSLDTDTFRRGVVRWRDAQRGGGPSNDLARLVVLTGARVLSHHDVGWPAVEIPADADPQILAQVALCAEASHEMWLSLGERGWLDAALASHRALREAGVTDPDALVRLSVEAEGVGQINEAIEIWSMIGSGVERDSGAWFEARFNILRLVAGRDRDEGVELIRAHVGLYPDYGPEPWGARLRTLGEQLGLDGAP
ncbi:MAG: hypothetical protein ACYTF7_11385, partial [Planctomycetota bacterium]